jgi:hypothetical protein
VLKYNSVPVKAELESPVEVGKIPKGSMAAVRNILNKQEPGGRRVGGRYDSKVWVKLVLDWCADNDAFAWAKNAENTMQGLPEN